MTEIFSSFENPYASRHLGGNSGGDSGGDSAGLADPRRDPRLWTPQRRSAHGAWMLLVALGSSLAHVAGVSLMFLASRGSLEIVARLGAVIVVLAAPIGLFSLWRLARWGRWSQRLVALAPGYVIVRWGLPSAWLFAWRLLTLPS